MVLNSRDDVPQRTVILDLADVKKIVEMGSWHASNNGRPCMTPPGQRNAKLYLSRVLTDAGPDETVEHVNGDLLDCTRSNLFKIVTPAKRKWGEGGGVYLEKKSGDWRAAPFVDGKRISLGRFDTEEAARAAVLAALGPKKIGGVYHDLNTGRWRVYSVKGEYLFTAASREEALEIRESHARGEWTKPVKHTGVTWDEQTQKWRAWCLKERACLGRYVTVELAQKARAKHEKTCDHRGKK